MMANRKITTVSQELELTLAAGLTLAAASISHGLLNRQHPVGDPRSVEMQIRSAYRHLVAIARARGITLEDSLP